ncbi:TrbI F-type domain-containing protein [Novosphingobium sp. P6W]|uniref:TrbI F-type domain-containing protein n=1 Tax=Novosphingobium sp. P6W TaxID=1609758 RepID=UPI000AF50633|nr:TrbI F-type domain-containing protein [Novosphingobium sp. P6W]
MIEEFKMADGTPKEPQQRGDKILSKQSRSPDFRETGSTGSMPSPKGLANLLGDLTDAPRSQSLRAGGSLRPPSNFWGLAIGAVAIVAILCWAAWITRALIDLERRDGRFVKMELQGVITEYLQAQARSGNDDHSAAGATTAFMSELDKSIAALSKSGKIVLVNEAVIGGDIPDVTDAVKKSVYAHVPVPQVARAPVEQGMQTYLAAGAREAEGGTGVTAP